MPVTWTVVDMLMEIDLDSSVVIGFNVLRKTQGYFPVFLKSDLFLKSEKESLVISNI